MEVAAKVGTSLALSALSPLLNKLSSKFGGDVTDEEMKHLDNFVRYEIEAVIEALTKVANSDESTSLLEKLQDAALEVVDLLDLYEYNKLEKQVSSSSSNPIKKFIPKIKETMGPMLIKTHLRKGVEKLLKFIAEVEKLHPVIMSRKGTTQPQGNATPTTSILSSPYFGRENQRDNIIEFLLDESHANSRRRTNEVPIIAIIGMGGSGKSHTAQRIYNDDRIKNHFDTNMWVHVTSDFDVVGLTRKMLESATNEICPNFENFDTLQKKLIESLSKRKRFLLVLDDVWCEDKTTWDRLIGPLNEFARNGSKIIITTRIENIAHKLNAKEIHLEDLKVEECWTILKHYAFCNDQETIDDEELRNVGNQIIKKAKHSPLSLKVVGSSLRNKSSANEWKKKLQQEDISKEAMDLLLFSYQCLPLRLQRCFAYCSLFPKGHIFYFDFRSSMEPQLIYLWIAQGFIKNTNKSTLEETGENYIKELISYSFFEKNNDSFVIDDSIYSFLKMNDSFVIHDLLHELAENVSKKTCHRIENYDSLHVPTTCIHLSVWIMNNLVCIDHSTILAICEIFSSRNLRSLIIWRGGFEHIFKSNKVIFQNLTKLRTLFVRGRVKREVPSDFRIGKHIDKLQLMRYLHVPHDSKLPTSLTKLYQLQFFILTTTNLKDKSGNYLVANTLPKCFSNLINLRTLKFYFCDCIPVELDYLHYNSKMINIGELSLQNLETIQCDDFNGVISLRNLNIGESFSIRNLDNVKCKEDAKEAMLNKKEKLNRLILEWGSTNPNSIDICKGVLEELEPHPNLEKLTITGYQADRFPNWMEKENWLPNLKILSLKSCRSLEIFPSLPPRLEELHVFDCDELMQLPPPPNDTLHTLRLLRCPKLTPPSMFKKSPGCSDLSFLPNLVGLILIGLPNVQALTDFSFFTNIKELCLRELPNLQALANLSPTMTELRIGDCPKLTSLGNLQRCTSLERLSIHNCPMVRREEASLVEGVVEGDIVNRLPQVEQIGTDEPSLVLELVQPQAFSSIKRLNISDYAAAALPNLEILPSLETLDIWRCADIESLPKLPVSLQSLWVNDCPKLKGMHEEGGPLHLDLKEKLSDLRINKCPAIELLPNLPDSLLILRIEECPAIELLPNLPDSLRYLLIQECPKLKEKYEEGGPLRHTISRIPVIEIRW